MTKRDILQSESVEENAKEIFKIFDDDADGYISLNEFNKVANTFDEKIDKHLQELFDSKEDKKISFEGSIYLLIEDFKRFVKRF